MRLWCLAATLAVLGGCHGRTAAPPPSPPLRAASPFDEGAKAAGIDFQQRSGRKEALDIIQTSAGGCGVLDYDRDGLLDLYFVQGKHQPGPDGGNRLYRNRGDGTFEDVTSRAGVRGHGYGIACAAGDFDADGWVDLYVCNFGTNELFRNRGDGTFEEVAARVGADIKGCSVAAVFAELAGDGWPDLYVARYVRITPRSQMRCQLNGVPTSCGPNNYEVEPGIFLQSEGGRRFVDRTAASGLVNTGRAMALTVGNVTGDGRPELLVTNDTSANCLFVRGAGGRYRDEALASGVAYGDLGVSEASMGVDLGDYDGDGRPDVYIGVMQDRMSSLFHNDGAGMFHFATRDADLGEASAPVVTWGCGFLDYDLDGDLDLFQVNGHVHNRIHDVDPRVQFEQMRQLFENAGGGRFVDRSAGAGPPLTQPLASRGAAFGDLDNDGDVDVVVNNLDGSPLLLWNRAERLGRHWLRVRLTGRRPNSGAEGATVTLKAGARTLVRHAHTAYSYAATNDPRVHFGLGEWTGSGTLEVRWPDGSKQQANFDGVDREVGIK